MTRQLTYADAARLLGGQSEIVRGIDQLVGGALLAVAPAVPAALGLIDAKAEFVRLCHGLVGRLRDRRDGLDRQSRTKRLHAAHTVLVVTAFFEVMSDRELPVRYRDLDLTRHEQLGLADVGHEVYGPLGTPVIEAAFTAEVPFPEAYEAIEGFEERLETYYRELAGAVLRFISGLAACERLTETTSSQLDELHPQLASAAVVRYQELVRRLAGDFPEAAWWIEDRQHRATRAEVRAIGTAMADLERCLAEIHTDQAPDTRRRDLATTYRKALTRPIVESDDAPHGIDIPTLDQAYLEPLFRVAKVASGTRVSDHGWWESVDVRDGLGRFLRIHLTQIGSTVAPLLVLGQPGSGKSVLTKVLAARLPAEQFLPVRVVLREVPAAADLQDQIECAIRAATGEQVSWPQLARSANGALPVVLLDGFDELLQATGVNQTDYLTKVARFQQREADLGRPVAVIVTSRTSVADRAQAPADTIALRLEPFDDLRVEAWLSCWNATNETNLGERGLLPLTAEIVLAHRELASQPLLLLMLALYDASGNALRKLAEDRSGCGSVDLGESELYERLLHSFCIREVTKQRVGLDGPALTAAVEEELRRLSIVSFGMFNRGTQWITQADLERDLESLFGRGTRADLRPSSLARPELHNHEPAAPAGLRGYLDPAEITLGRFFFIHRTQARRGDITLQTYEFLHATFGEYLVARFTWTVLCHTAARQSASTLRMNPDGIDDDLLHALLSFAPLSVRAPITGFLTELVAKATEVECSNLVELLLDLYRQVHEPRHSRSFAGYLPQRLGVPARHAAYSANLVLLAVCVGGSVRASQLYPFAQYDQRFYDLVDLWHSDALLWRSQLTGEEWSSIVERLRLDRVWTEQGRDVVLSLDDGSFAVPRFDPSWTYRIQPGQLDQLRHPVAFEQAHHHPDVVRRKSHFLCGNLDDVAHHALDPLTEALPKAFNTTVSYGEQTLVSAAHTVLAALLAPVTEQDPGRRAETYGRCTALFHNAFRQWSDSAATDLARLLFDRLATDSGVPPMTVANALVELEKALPYGWLARHQGFLPAVTACVAATTGQNEHSDMLIRQALNGLVLNGLALNGVALPGSVLAVGAGQVPWTLAEALVVCYEKSTAAAARISLVVPLANLADFWPDLLDRFPALAPRFPALARRPEEERPEEEHLEEGRTEEDGDAAV